MGFISARDASPGVPFVLGVERLDLLVRQDLVHGFPLLPIIALPAERHVANELRTCLRSRELAPKSCFETLLWS